MKVYARTDQCLFTSPDLNLLHLLCGRMVLREDPCGSSHPALTFALSNLCTRPLNAQDHNYHEQVFRFIFHFLLPPPSIPSFASLSKPLAYLLAQLCTVAETGHEFQCRFLDSVRLLMECLNGFVPPPAAPTSPKDYFLYYFHLDSWSAEDGEILDSYRRYGLVSHWHLVGLMHHLLSPAAPGERRRAEEKQSEEYETAIALTHFMRFYPLVLIGQQEPIVDVRPSPLRLWSSILRAKYAKDSGEESSIGELTTVYNTVLRLLTVFRYRDPHRRGSLSISSESPIPSAPTLASRLDTARRRLVRIGFQSEPLLADAPCPADLRHECHHAPNLMAIIEAGESPHEHAQYHMSAPQLEQFEGRPLKSRLYKLFLAKAAQVAASFRFFFDRHTLPISIYSESITALITDYIATRSLNSMAKLSSSVIAMFTGLKPDKVLTMHFLPPAGIKPTADHDGIVFLDDPNGCLAYLLDTDACGYYKGDGAEFLKQCRPTSQIVYVPIYPFVFAILRAYLSLRNALQDIPPELHDVVFLSDGNPGISPLSFQEINNTLAGLVVSPSDNPVSLARLASSFLTHATSQLHLDPVLACFVSRRAPLAFKAQMFYTHVEFNSLMGRYFRACDAFRDLLFHEIRALTITSSPIWEFLLAARQDSIGINPTPPLGYAGTGSRCVLNDSHLLEFSSTLKASLARLDEQLSSALTRRLLLTYFSLFMIHQYFVYSLGSTIRPLACPPINKRTVKTGCQEGEGANAIPSHILIRDKSSGRFSTEARVVPHARIVHDVLLGCWNAIERMRPVLNRYGCSIDSWLAEEDCPAFFILDQKGVPRHLSPSVFKRYLASVDDLASLYLVPINAPRHYLRTYLYEQGVACSLIDHFFGHSHEGHEPTHVHSAARIREAELQFVFHVEAMLSNLNLRTYEFTLPA